MKPRRVSKAIQVGEVTVGGGAPITVQSMTKTDTRDINATVRQIKELEDDFGDSSRLHLVTLSDKFLAYSLFQGDHRVNCLLFPNDCRL